MKKMLTAALAAAITMGMCPAAEIPVMAANTGSEAVVDSGPPPLQGVTRTDIYLTDFLIEGKPQVGETLTIKVIPEGAMVLSYRWARSAPDGGYSEDVSRDSSYTLTADDWNHFITVWVAGTDGVEISRSLTKPIESAPLTGVTIAGKLQVGETLTAKVSPDGATASYQWRRIDANGNPSAVVSTSGSYTLKAADSNHFIEVEATGTDSYTGTQTSAKTNKIQPAPLTDIRIEGKPQVGQTLTAKVSPDGATASYQWRRVDANGNPSAVVSTSGSYALTAADWNCKIEVEATGTGGYTGTQTSAKTNTIQPAPLTGVTIEGTPQVGETLTAKVSPDGATASYQWRRVDANGNPSAVVSTSGSYTLTAADLNCKIEVEATGTGGYTGTKTASTTEIQPVPPSPSGSTGGGTTGSSSGGSSSGGGSSRQNSSMITANKDQGSAGTGGGNDPAAATRDVTAQLEAAKAAGRTPRADVVAKNTKSVSPETLRAMNEAAAKQGGTARFLADTTQDGQIVARMYLDAAAAANLTGDIQTGVSVDGKEAEAVANHFAQHFTNPVKVVSFSQKGSFGMKVGLALKVDLSGLDVENLVFYSYDIATNSYQEIETACFVDMNGYLHLTVDFGGSLVIADRALTPR